MSSSDVYWKRGRGHGVRRPLSRRRQLAGDAVAGMLVGLVILLGVVLLLGP